MPNSRLTDASQTRPLSLLLHQSITGEIALNMIPRFCLSGSALRWMVISLMLIDVLGTLPSIAEAQEVDRKQLNVRTTILMTLEGNLVQVPNAKVYKSNIRNFTTNPSRREDFVVTIGYIDSISDAQDTASRVLREHVAVLKDPEPSVLVDSLGAGSVNLRVYFWINGRDHSWLKVRSSVIRLVKLAFQKQGFAMPDDPRKLIFPAGVSVSVSHGKNVETTVMAQNQPAKTELNKTPDEVSTQAEGGLDSEAITIERQARNVEPLKEKDNLLAAAPKPALETHVPKHAHL